MRATRPHSYAASAATALLGIVSFLFSSSSAAAGAWMNEDGGPDMAMAAAGRAALVTDGTTIAANPAGMAALDGPGFVAVVLPMALDLEFHGTGATPGRAVSDSPATPAASVFATGKAGRWSLGFGAYSNVGLGCDFGTQWAGRRAVENAQFSTLNLVPAVAYRLTDRLDVGASIGAQLADAEASLAVGNDATYYGPPAALPDGRLSMSGRSWAPVTSLGASYRASDGTRFGLAWTSPVDHSMNLDVGTSGLHPVLEEVVRTQGAAGLDVRLPQQLIAGVARPVGPDTLLAASAGWQQWSRFGQSSLRVADRSSPLFEDGLDDTWSLAVGVRQRLNPRWTLSGGVSYDSDPSSGGTMPIYFPVAEQLRVAAGAEYRASEALRLRLSLSVVNQGRILVAQESHPLPLPGIPPVTGTIDGSRLYVLGLTGEYRP